MKLFWFDTETSGIDPEKNGIIQLAYLIEIDGVVKTKGILEADPRKAGKVLDEEALKVNGYTPEKLDAFQAPFGLYRKLTAALELWVNKYDRNDKFTMAGFNVEFDVKFLRQLWIESNDQFFGSWFGYGVVDPSQVWRFLQYAGMVPQNLVKSRLVDLAAHFGIDTEDAHDALADILMTRKVTEKLVELINEKPPVVGRGKEAEGDSAKEG